MLTRAERTVSGSGKQAARDFQQAAVVFGTALYVHVGGVGQLGDDGVTVEAVVSQECLEEGIAGIEPARTAGVGHAGFVDADHGQAVVERDSRGVQVGARVQLDAGAEAHDQPVVLDDREVSIECLAAHTPPHQVAARLHRAVGQRPMVAYDLERQDARLESIQPRQVSIGRERPAGIDALQVAFEDDRVIRDRAVGEEEVEVNGLPQPEEPAGSDPLGEGVLWRSPRSNVHISWGTISFCAVEPKEPPSQSSPQMGEEAAPLPTPRVTLVPKSFLRQAALL